MKIRFKRYILPLVPLIGMCTAQIGSAAVSLDRTRVIYVGGERSISLGISNQNTQLPYLAQAWIENELGEKITSPLVVLPPIQRLEAGVNSQVKLQGLPELDRLPQDRESLFYFNLREIPPRSDKPNSLQIALQTRVKLFYRPAAIAKMASANEATWQEKLTLTLKGDRYTIKNPTPYYVTLIDASSDIKAPGAEGFKPFMLAPQSELDLGLSRKVLGDKPVLTYVNDYGGRPQLQFKCAGDTCAATSVLSTR